MSSQPRRSSARLCSCRSVRRSLARTVLRHGFERRGGTLVCRAAFRTGTRLRRRRRPAGQRPVARVSAAILKASLPASGASTAHVEQPDAHMMISTANPQRDVSAVGHSGSCGSPAEPTAVATPAHHLRGQARTETVGRMADPGRTGPMWLGPHTWPESVSTPARSNSLCLQFDPWSRRAR